MDIFEEHKASGISRSHRLSILPQCSFLVFGVLVYTFTHTQIHFLRLKLVRSFQTTGISPKKKSTKLLLLWSATKWGLVWHLILLLFPASDLLQHPGVADAQSGIQTWQRSDRWVTQCDDRAQIAAALLPHEDSVCHTPICTRQIHRSHSTKAEDFFSLVRVNIWNYSVYDPCYSSAACRACLVFILRCKVCS